MTKFSAKIRELRGDQSLSDFGYRIGVASSTVWRWETEDRLPSAEKRREIAEKLGIDPSEFESDVTQDLIDVLESRPLVRDLVRAIDVDEWPDGRIKDLLPR